MTGDEKEQEHSLAEGLSEWKEQTGQRAQGPVCCCSGRQDSGNRQVCEKKGTGHFSGMGTEPVYSCQSCVGSLRREKSESRVLSPESGSSDE